MQPPACPVTAARHQAGLLLCGQQELVKLAVFRGLNAPNMTGHSYHATARCERMFVSGEMELTCSGSTKEVQYLLLHIG